MSKTLSAITLTIDSDEAFKNVGVEPPTEGTWLHVAKVGNSEKWNLSADFNHNTVNRYSDIYIKAQIKGKDVISNALCIKQGKHPNEYTEGNTWLFKPNDTTPLTTLETDEFGEVFYIASYAQINGNKKCVIPDLFSISSSGDCDYNLSTRPIVTEEFLYWECKIHKNTELNDKSITLQVSFDYGDFGNWKSQKFTITQKPHQRIITTPIVSASPSNLSFNGGDVIVTAYYTVDNTCVRLPDLSWEFVDGSTVKDGVRLTGSGSTGYYVTFDKNQTKTHQGEINKIVQFSVKNPENGNIITTNKVTQTSQKIETSYNLKFADSTINKTIEEAYASSAQTISFEVISNKLEDGEVVDEIPIKVSGDSSSNWVTFVQGTKMQLKIANNQDGQTRYANLEIAQNTEIDNGLRIYLHICQIDQVTTVIPAFDYMIITYGFDILSGKDLDTITYIPEMPVQYEKFKAVGYDAMKYLKNKEFPTRSDLTFTNNGDTDNYSLAWAGDNTVTGAESVALSPKQFLTSEYIQQAKDNGKEYFDIDIYGIFYNIKNSGVITIRMMAYKEDGTDDSKLYMIQNEVGNGKVFMPGKSAKNVWGDYKNAIVHAEGKYKGEDFKDNYTKVATLRYTYNESTWRLLQDSTVGINANVITHPSGGTETEDSYKEMISNVGLRRYIYYKDDSKLDKNTIFGRANYIISSSNSGTTSVFLDKGNDVDYIHYQKVPPPYSANTLALYYDQTKYNVNKIATGNSTSTINTVTWITEPSEVASLKWIVDSSLDGANKLYLSLINLFSSQSAEIIEKQSYNISSNDYSVDVPTGKITGTFIDGINGLQSTFTIESGSARTRTITWDDTSNGDTSANRYVTIDASSIKVNGQQYLNKLVGATSFKASYTNNTVPIDSFKWYYNAQPYIVLKWMT